VHQPECAMNALIGNQAQKWGLFKLYRQPLAKRLLKDGVACRCREIGENNGVFVRESWCGLKIEVPCAEERQHGRGSTNDHLRAPCDAGCRSGLRAGGST